MRAGREGPLPSSVHFCPNTHTWVATLPRWALPSLRLEWRLPSHLEVGEEAKWGGACRKQPIRAPSAPDRAGGPQGPRAHHARPPVSSGNEPLPSRHSLSLTMLLLQEGCLAEGRAREQGQARRALRMAPAPSSQHCHRSGQSIFSACRRSPPPSGSG